MSRSRLGLLGLCVMVLGLMAFAASSASAAEWLILNGKGEVKTAKELPATIAGDFEEKTDGTFLTKLVGLAVSVLCTLFALENAQLQGGGTVAPGFTVFFTGCTVPVPGPGLCTVHSPALANGNILTLELKATLQANGEVLIEPKVAGAALADLIFEGPECPLPTGAAQAVNGVVWLKDCEAKITTHLVKHLFEESKAHYTKDVKGVVRLGTMFIGKDTEEHLETYLDGSGWVFLSGAHAGLSWGGQIP
jgi:hypothetical protein